MAQSHNILERFADALEAKAKASSQDEDGMASDELIEIVGDIERNAAETASLLRQLLLQRSSGGQ